MKVTWKNDALIEAEVRKAVLDGAEEWLRVDVLPVADQNCPTDRGVMKGSNAIVRDGAAVLAGPYNEGDTFGGKQGEVVIGYGGAASAYVERQHEDMTLTHPSGEAKWLENAFNGAQSTLSEKIKSRVAAVLK